MTTTQSIITIAAVWLAVALVVGIPLGRALKALSRDWHEDQRTGQ